MWDEDTSKLSTSVIDIWNKERPEGTLSIKGFMGDAGKGIRICVTSNKAVWCVSMGSHKVVLGLFMLRRGDSVIYAFSLSEILDKVEKLRPQFDVFKPDTKIARLEKRMAAMQSELAALKAEKATQQGFQLRA